MNLKANIARALIAGRLFAFKAYIAQQAGQQSHVGLLVGGVHGLHAPAQIGRAHVWTPVTNAQLVSRLLLAKKTTTNVATQPPPSTNRRPPTLQGLAHTHI